MVFERDYLEDDTNDEGTGFSYTRRTESVYLPEIDARFSHFISLKISRILGPEFIACNPIFVNGYLDGNHIECLRYAIEHISIDSETGEEIGSGIIGCAYVSYTDPYTDPIQSEILAITPKKMLMENLRYTEKYPFMQDGVFLVATIDPQSEDMQIIFQKTDHNSSRNEIFNELDWNPKIFAEFSYIEYLNLKKDTIKLESFVSKFKKNESNNRSFRSQVNTEADKESIYVNLDAKFAKFKGWVQTLAQQGMNAIRFQQKIDMDVKSCVVDSLFTNMMLADRTFLIKYLNKIKKENRIKGDYDRIKLRAELDLIVGAINQVDFFYEYASFC